MIIQFGAAWAVRHAHDIALLHCQCRAIFQHQSDKSASRTNNDQGTLCEAMEELGYQLTMAGKALAVPWCLALAMPPILRQA